MKETETNHKSLKNKLSRCNLKRAVDGIFLLDKPTGITSNVAMKKVQRFFLAEKAGHTGSLDPLATGMLPICLGEATKFSQYGLDADKTYVAKAAWSIQTDSADATGSIIAHGAPITFDSEAVQAVLGNFMGDIEQSPSLFSALKYQGRPLYEYARQGIAVPKKCRIITIYSLSLLSFDRDHFSIRVHCSKGTYIRTLVEDIAAKLGTYAHIVALHRESVAGFEGSVMHSLESLGAMTTDDKDAQLLGTDYLLQSFPMVYLDAVQTISLLQGRELSLASDANTLRAYQTEGSFLGLIRRVESGFYRGLRLVRSDRALLKL